MITLSDKTIFNSEEEITKKADSLTKEQWREISTHVNKLSYEFINNFKGDLDWFKIGTLNNLSFEFIMSHKKEISWISVTMHHKFSESEIEEIFDYINSEESNKNIIKILWDNISYSQMLSEEFIRKNKDKLNWKDIIRTKNLSIDFILEFEERIDWEELSKNIIIEEKVLRHFINRLNLASLMQYRRTYFFSEEFLEEIIDNPINKKHYNNLFFFQKFSEKLLEKLISQKEVNKNDWKTICVNQNLSIEFLKKHYNNIEFSNVIRSKHLTLEKLYYFENELTPFIEQITFINSPEIRTFFQESLITHLKERKSWWRKIGNVLSKIFSKIG